MSAAERSVKQGIPTDDELEELGGKIETEWMKLGRRLGIPDVKLHEIKLDHDELSEKGYYMLLHWKQKQGFNATYQALCDGLTHPLVQRLDLAEQFCYVQDYACTPRRISVASASASKDQEDSRTVGRKRKMSEPHHEPAVKHGIPTYDVLEELGDKIRRQWIKLGRRLGISDEMLQEIHQAHGELSQKGYYTLKLWKRKQGSTATYQALSDALKHKLVQRPDLAEQFCYVRDYGTPRRISVASASASKDQEDSRTVGRKRKMSEPHHEPAVKHGILTDHEIEELGVKIERKWKKLGRRLGINEATLQEISQAHDELSERGYHMLMNWKQKQGSDATYQALCHALKHDLVQCQDLAEQFCYVHDYALKIRINMDYMKPAELNTQDTTPVPAPDGHQKASTVPTDNFDPAEIIDEIRQLYKSREGRLAPFPWCEEFHFRLDDIFTRLKVVSRKKTRGTTTTDTVDMSEIFKVPEDCPQPRTVLIEGKRGMGKTTYCQKLVYDWATGKQPAEDSFPRFELVLLLRCRDTKSADIWEAIDDQLLPRDVEKDARERFIDFIRHNQSNILLILDGLEEAPANKLPVFSEIIQGRVLPKCRLVATARHEAGMKVRRDCDTLLEIEGFTEEDVQKFIFKYFKTRDDLAQKLLFELQNDKNLKEMAANPLDTALLCLLCEEFQGVFPDSRAELYLEFVQCVLRRYMQKEGLSKDNEELIEAYKPQLKHLGWIALKGLREGNLDFEESELGSFAGELPCFGFLSFQLGSSKLRPRRWFSFLHGSFQVFFAAFYPMCGQLLDKEISTDSLVGNRVYFHQLKEVIPFVFGMLTARSQETAVALITSISAKFNQEVKTDVGYLSRLLLECIKECSDQSKAAVAHAVGVSLQLPNDSLASLAESLEQWKKDSSEGVIPPEIIVRGRSALEAYNKALTEGKTYDKRVPIMFIGREHSGKTSLKKSLRGETFKPDEMSTVGIDADSFHFKVTTEVWKVGEKDQEKKWETPVSFEYQAARAAIENLRQEEETPHPEDRITDSMQTKNIPMEKPPVSTTVAAAVAAVDVTSTSSPTIKVTSASSSTTSIQDGNLQDDTSGSEETADVPESVELPKPENVIPEGAETVMINMMKNDTEVEDEESVYSVLWDFAGQSVYYTTHPLFLTQRAIYLLVSDLSQDPFNEAARPECETFEDSFYLKTNFDYLDFWMSSVASITTQEKNDHNSSESEVLPEKLPAVFLVFTHADAPYDKQSLPKTLARKVLESLQTKPYEAHLYKDFFVVDNTKSGHGHECPEVERLRKEVLDVAKELPQRKEAIPIKWLKWENELKVMREGGEKWITLETAKAVASEKCNIIDDEEFRTLLNFLHDKRILIHFDDTPELDKVVILDPQWLIDVFKKVITVPPRACMEKKFKTLWRNLGKDGILEQKLLEHVWTPLLNSEETFQSLIAMMEKFSLLCLWPSSDASCDKRYLVPSMLRSHPPEGVKNLFISAQIPPLCLKFESGQVPPGLFSRLVLKFFQSGKVACANPQLYHNFARFYCIEKKNCSVILQCCSSHIKVVVHRGDGSEDTLQSPLSAGGNHDTFDMSCAHDVRKQLELMLESMREEFFWLKNMKYEVSFICPVCCQGGAVSFCKIHGKDCKQEECLDFLPVTQLVDAKNEMFCTNSADAQNNRIQLKQFSPWFAPQGNHDLLTVEQQDRRHSATVEGVKRKRKLTTVSRNKCFKPISGMSKDFQVVVRKGKPDEDLLEGLAGEITAEWVQLGRRLSINNAKIQEILMDPLCREKPFTMLLHWKQKFGSKATFHVLYDALCHDFVQRRDLAEKYCCVKKRK